MIRTRGVSHIELAVDHIDRAIHFYSNVFGFEVVHRNNHHAVLRTPGAPGSLALQQVGQKETAQRVRFGLSLVEPGDLDAAISLALENGGLVITRTDHPVGGSTAVIADPTGHRITL